MVEQLPLAVSSLVFVIILKLSTMQFLLIVRLSSTRNTNYINKPGHSIKSFSTIIALGYKRVSILKIETTDEFAKYNKLIIKMDGLSALVWSKKTFSELELNWDGSSSFRNKILHSFQISTSNPSCFFNTCRASSITIYIFNIFY